MRLLDVKNTMIPWIVGIMAPHYCSGCEKLGSMLCDNCKYNIVEEHFTGCLKCGKASGSAGVCAAHALPYARAWCVSGREGAVQKLVDDYKFERLRSAHKVLAELLDTSLPVLPPDVIVVPVPTIAPHVRLRGYDHTLLIAREFARRRGLQLRPGVLRRRTFTQQRGKTHKQRMKQASEAFRAHDVNPGATYLLCDDVFTTGATVKYAAKALRDGGAGAVWVAMVSKQISK